MKSLSETKGFFLFRMKGIKIILNKTDSKSRNVCLMKVKLTNFRIFFNRNNFTYEI